MVDEKKDFKTEDSSNYVLKKEVAWDLLSLRQERTGNGENDWLKHIIVKEDGDVLTTIYADNTQSRTWAK